MLATVKKTAPLLSGRARTALQKLQRSVHDRDREMRQADHLLSGALVAGDESTQSEMLAVYTESVQELRACVQRLEMFLLTHVTTAPKDT